MLIDRKALQMLRLCCFSSRLAVCSLLVAGLFEGYKRIVEPVNRPSVLAIRASFHTNDLRGRRPLNGE